jgi:membrane protein
MTAIRNQLLALRLSVTEFLADRGVDRSAALAYVTLLSVVPLFATLAALYRAFFPFEIERLIEMVTAVLPYQVGSEQHTKLVETLTEFVNRATALGYISSLIFLVIGFRLFLSVETTFNDLWNIKTRRTPAIRVFSFTMLVFWGPVVIGLGSSLLLWMGHQPWSPSKVILLPIARIVLPMLGLTMVYWLAPHTGVRIKSAVAGGVTATVGLELIRQVFIWYLDLFPEINIIYGSVTLSILFLLSLFAFWVVVILGVEVSYVVQNFQPLRQEFLSGRPLDDEPCMVAVAILTECFRRSIGGEAPPSLDELEATFDVRHGAAQEAVDRLINAGLLAITGEARDSFVPAHSAAQVTVARALESCGADCAALPRGAGSAMSQLEELLKRGEHARREVLGQTTFADLVASDDTRVRDAENTPT